jgi:hypothetical protein
MSSLTVKLITFDPVRVAVSSNPVVAITLRFFAVALGGAATAPSASAAARQMASFRGSLVKSRRTPLVATIGVNE